MDRSITASATPHLNAAPFALAGEPPTNPSYVQNSFGGSIGGPLNIPKIYHGGTKTFFFVNYNGRRGENPFDQFSTVPTLLQRQGNFSQTNYTSGPKTGQPVQIFDPTTNTPFANNTIPQINPTAAGLLAYIPLPNLTPGGTSRIFISSPRPTTAKRRSECPHQPHIRAAPAGGAARRRRRRAAQQLDLGLPLSRIECQHHESVPQRGWQYQHSQL